MMKTLLNDYYRIDSQTAVGNEILFRVTLLPEYCAYAGHFPGNPVSPGVCNIQMVKECAVQLTGQPLFLCYISHCRWSAVITPQTTPHLQIRMQLSEAENDRYKVCATVCDDTTIYMKFNGELTPVK